MNSVFDTDDNPLTHVAINLSENGVRTFTVRVPCIAGMYLTADVPEYAPAAILARFTGSGDPFVDIATTPLTLTEHAGSTISFDIRVEAGNVAGRQRLAVPIRVTFNP